MKRVSQISGKNFIIFTLIINLTVLIYIPLSWAQSPSPGPITTPTPMPTPLPPTPTPTPTPVTDWCDAAVAGIYCCKDSNPCSWDNDTYCDCSGYCSWDTADCAEPIPTPTPTPTPVPPTPTPTPTPLPPTPTPTPTPEPRICGDNTINQPSEQCDRYDLNGASCVTLGFDNGTLSCDNSCVYDTSACYLCGNAVIEPGEQCDQDDLGGNSCFSLGHDSGTLACDSSCRLDDSACKDFTCGDNVVNQISEDCDGPDLNGADCTDLNYDAGTLQCAANCLYDDSLCYNNPDPTPVPPTPTPTPVPPTPTPLPPTPTPTPAPPLSVDLIALNKSGQSPLTVIFSPQIQNIDGRYTGSWDFNNDAIIDAQTYMVQSRNYTYTEPGIYTACLTVTDQRDVPVKACVSDITVTAADPEPPAPPMSVELVAYNKTGESPLTVNFEVKVMNAQEPYSGTWDYNNDGIIDSPLTYNLSHTYTEVGTYTACVIITDQSTVPETACVSGITVESKPEPTPTPVPPTPTPTPMTSPTPTPTPIPTSPPTDPTPTPTPVPTLPPVHPTPTPTPMTSPTPTPSPSATWRPPFNVTLKAFNIQGHVPHQVVFVPTIEGDISTCTAEWDYNNDGTVDDTGPFTKFYTYTEPGYTRPCVTVTNAAAETVKACVTSDIVTKGPIEVDLAANPLMVKQGIPVSFDLTVRNTIGRYAGSWDFDNDGIMDEPGYANKTHLYNAPGDYIARVFITDSHDGSGWGEVLQPIHVWDAALTCGDTICSPHEDALTCPDDCEKTFCSNGIDDDFDGLTDLDDPDCENTRDTSEFSAGYFDAVLDPGEKHHLFDGWFIEVNYSGDNYSLYNTSRPVYDQATVSDMIQAHIDEGKAHVKQGQGNVE